jgi:hypothetical protein
MRVFFFGCWDQAGHFMFGPGGRHVRDERRATPWESHDAVLCPGYVGPYDNGPQVEGEAGLHHKDGWTALCFWDRSIDGRGGCNSGFYAEGTYGAAAMIEIAREHFPTVWARFPFEVRVVSRPTDVVNAKSVCPTCGRLAFGASLDGWAHDPPGWFSKGRARACSVACVTKAEALDPTSTLR